MAGSASLSSPRTVGVLCATAATVLGLFYLAAAGAPTIHLWINALSLVMGLAFMAVIAPGALASRSAGVAVAVLGGLLLATALFGLSVDGASRWIRVAGLSLQVSLIVLPAMLVVFARDRRPLATVGIMLAAIGLALQPDRAMAGALLAALAVLAVYTRDRWVVLPLAVATAGFGVTMLRPDTLPAVPFVDQILYTAFDVHALVGLAVALGSLLLIVPALTGLLMDPPNRQVHAVFGTIWLAVVAAAALGNYPTPLVGYGGSAILGYALSLACMPARVPAAATVTEPAKRPPPPDPPGHVGMRVRLPSSPPPHDHLHTTLGLRS